MSLKSLIQRLLDSRTTPAQAGHASKPSSAVPVDYNPSASVDNWGPVLSNSTAGSDGYIWAAGRTTSDKGFFQINTQALQITTTGTSNPGGEILNLFTPVSKGQLFSVYGRYLEQITVRFVKTIGGYNRLVRRALSCLRALSNFSPRSFCKANPNGLRPKAFQKGGCSCHLRLPNMSLLTMDTLAFTKTLQTRETLLMFMPLTQLIQSLQGFAWGALRRGLLHILQSFLLEKDARLLLLMMQIQSKNYGSRRLSEAINNLGVGGALC